MTTGNELFKLAASDTALGDGFGNSLAISGNTAIIGAAFKQSNAAAGAVYLFDLTTGQELLKLTASDAADHDVFGILSLSAATPLLSGHPTMAHGPARRTCSTYPREKSCSSSPLPTLRSVTCSALPSPSAATKPLSRRHWVKLKAWRTCLT